MTCNHCGSTDISTKVWFCWSCCKQIQTPEQEYEKPTEQITEEQIKPKESKGKKK